MLGFSKRKKTPKKVNVQFTDAKCRVMTDLLSEKGDDAVQSWRIFRIMSEFVSGFEVLRKYGTAVTFFGSSRTKANHRHYQEARELAGLLAKSGFAVITGGGGGIMSGANNGAFEAGGQSVGLNIDLPVEQKTNVYLTEKQEFHFFFSRKVMLSFASEVYVYFPGGYGTLDEFFEILTLVQTEKISKIPIVLYDKEFWEPLLSFIKRTLLAEGMISKGDMELFVVVDSVEEAYQYITTHVDPCTPRQV